MKRIAAILFLLSAMCINVFAQSLVQSIVDEVNKIKQIKMLETPRADVQKLLSGYQASYDAPENKETFSSAKLEIEVSYTSGTCADNSAAAGAWNIEKGMVDFIDISFGNPVKFEDLKYKASDYRKERMVIDKEEAFIYHDKNQGISFLVEGGKIVSIFLFPSTRQSVLLCKNEKSNILKEFYSRESYLPVSASKQ